MHVRYSGPRPDPVRTPSLRYFLLSIVTTVRVVAPDNSCRGRPIVYSGSMIISCHRAIQPTVRACEKLPVNTATGMPGTFRTMPA
jgi:hypothetical protein